MFQTSKYVHMGSITTNDYLSGLRGSFLELMCIGDKNLNNIKYDSKIDFKGYIN